MAKKKLINRLEKKKKKKADKPSFIPKGAEC